MCYKLLSTVGGLYIKKTIGRVSQGRICVKKASIKFNFHIASIQLNDLSISNEHDLKKNLRAKTVFAKIKIRPLLNRELVCDNIIVVEPHVNIKLPFSSRRTEKTSAFKKSSSPESWKYTVKRMEAKGGNIYYYNASSKSSIKNINLILNDFSLTSPFPFSLKGHVLSGENRTELVASGRILHIPESLRIADMEIESSVSVSSKNSISTIPIDFTGKVILENNVTSIEIEKCIYDDIKVVIPHDPLYIRNRVLHIHGVKLKLAEGEAELLGKLNFSSPYGIEFDSIYKIKNVDIQKLVSKFGIENLTFSGALNCEGDIRSRGNSIDKIRKNLSGNLDITLNNGYLTRQHILVRMFTLINMYDVIKLRFPKMDKEGIKYNIATAKAVIDSGIINVKSLYIDGERMRMSGRGDINLVEMTTNMIFGVEFLQIIDEVLNKIPIVGYIITGENGNLFAFYVRLKSCKGGQLKVTVVPHELLGDVTIRLFQRLLKLPLRMMTPITKYISKKKNVKNRR
ncbi:AsmA-like C-terminal domain-containing protein [bacterium]|nr:AsmA-like C-terminal domain-containing protein [bacterium]